MNSRKCKLRIKPSKIKYYGVGYTTKPTVKKIRIETKLQPKPKVETQIEAKAPKLEPFIIPLQPPLFKWSDPVKDITVQEIIGMVAVNFRWGDPTKDYDTDSIERLQKNEPRRCFETKSIFSWSDIQNDIPIGFLKLAVSYTSNERFTWTSCDHLDLDAETETETEMNDGNNPKEKNLVNAQQSSFNIPKLSGWNCDVCLVPNKKDSTKCVACETEKAPLKDSATLKPGFDFQKAGFSITKSNGWTCEVCMVPNSSAASKCISCESDGPKSKAKKPPTASGFDFKQAGFSIPKSTGWTCSVCMVPNQTAAIKCVSCESPKT